LDQWTNTRSERLHLDREAHVKFLLKGLGTLSEKFQSLDASKSWICYWILHSLDLMNALPPRDVLERWIDDQTGDIRLTVN
jgi:protein farnesyltransferase subunit beta